MKYKTIKGQNKFLRTCILAAKQPGLIEIWFYNLWNSMINFVWCFIGRCFGQFIHRDREEVWVWPQFNREWPSTEAGGDEGTSQKGNQERNENQGRGWKAEGGDYGQEESVGRPEHCEEVE